MKTIILDRHIDAPLSHPPVARVAPGSAMIGASKPVFVPDCFGEWTARPMLAVHLSRLGKSVTQGFANRYYDRLAVMMHLEPAMPPPYSASLLDLIDATLWMGPELDIAALGDRQQVKTQGLTFDFALSQLSIDQAVALISQYTTLQMGDYLVVAILDAAIPLRGREDIEVSLNTKTEILKIR